MLSATEFYLSKFASYSLLVILLFLYQQGLTGILSFMNLLAGIFITLSHFDSLCQDN